MAFLIFIKSITDYEKKSFLALVQAHFPPINQQSRMNNQALVRQHSSPAVLHHFPRIHPICPAVVHGQVNFPHFLPVISRLFTCSQEIANFVQQDRDESSHFLDNVFNVYGQPAFIHRTSEGFTVPSLLDESVFESL